MNVRRIFWNDVCHSVFVDSFNAKNVTSEYFFLEYFTLSSWFHGKYGYQSMFRMLQLVIFKILYVLPRVLNWVYLSLNF